MLLTGATITTLAMLGKDVPPSLPALFGRVAFGRRPTSRYERVDRRLRPKRASVWRTNGTSLSVSSPGRLSELPSFRLWRVRSQFAALLKLVPFVWRTDARKLESQLLRLESGLVVVDEGGFSSNAQQHLAQLLLAASAVV